MFIYIYQLYEFKRLSDFCFPIKYDFVYIIHMIGALQTSRLSTRKVKSLLAENYRPISLTSVCCKTMEHILVSKMMKHGEENNILYPLQHGFRKGRSCETQLIEFVDDISKNLQEGQQTDILILDFAKAFDKVNHSLLTHKLQHYGIIGKSVRWIHNCLANRKQSVVIDGSTSDAVSVDSWVPQGSVLGPGLFLYYINDLQSRLTSTVRLFVDDTWQYPTTTMLKLYKKI